MPKTPAVRLMAVNTAKVLLYDKLSLVFPEDMDEPDATLWRTLARDPAVREKRPGAFAYESIAQRRLDQLELFPNGEA